jgi:hypothetical protein
MASRSSEQAEYVAALHSYLCNSESCEGKVQGPEFRGTILTELTAEMSAPLAKRRETSSVWPSTDACISAVRPS